MNNYSHKSSMGVSGDTLVLTSKGTFPIKRLAESSPPVHNVWNGEEFTKARFGKYGFKAYMSEILIRIDRVSITRAGEKYEEGKIMSLKCTPNQKFFVDMTDEETMIGSYCCESYENDYVERIDARNLPNFMLQKFELPERGSFKKLKNSGRRIDREKYIIFIPNIICSDRTESEDSYSFTEGKRHRAVLNGVLVGDRI